MKATLTKITHNVELTSKAGKPYFASILDVKKEDGTSKSLTLVLKELKEKAKELQEGDFIEIKYVKDGAHFNIADIGKALGSSSPAKKFEKKSFNSSSTFSVDGVIKGNSITNGVSLAIARHGKDTTLDHIRKASLEIISLHKELEGLKITTSATEKKTLADAEDLNDDTTDAF